LPHKKDNVLAEAQSSQRKKYEENKIGKHIVKNAENNDRNMNKVFQ